MDSRLVCSEVIAKSGIEFGTSGARGLVKNFTSDVNAAFAVDTELGPTYILKVNQALDFTGSMTNSLLCTNQVRANGLIVDDIPPAFDRLGNSTFSIYDLDKQIRLPLQNKGPIPHLNVRYPTNDDLERFEYIELTSESDQWDPK